ncbi:hypothetical protein CANARDRAFT_28683 [[Candida] arabinofermentans NRRL YB-2248]|uniref:Uncharacterized protein n=1 Tax=[Candida] arabinofermentans NRRL YB-2248 TaxID=983967 RepID=A0A1E4SZN5_9ASCO|nr:hypothetical protein CANARDRAFT_28683 [[Candida] arabinofermentans NRRL YB-2248]
MDVYHRFIDPTTCQCSLYCNFTKPAAKNLVISKGSLLQVFEIVEIEAQDDENDIDEAVADVLDSTDMFLDNGMMTSLIKQRQYKLSLITEYRLNGEIINIAKFKSNENDILDYLQISIGFAKLIIVKWDDHSHSISTVSLHYYEPVLESLSVVKPSQCDVKHRTDPNGLCTSFQMNELFTFLPFYKDFLEDDDQGLLLEENEIKEEKPAKEELTTIKDSKRKKLYNDSFIINSSTLNPELKDILDYQYLYSYRDPTVAILYAPTSMTWAGYLPNVKDNMKCVVLSLDLEKQKATTIMELDSLPYDLDYIYPLPEPINGFLLVGSNEIVFTNSLGSIKGIATNEYYQQSASLKLKDQSDLALKLDGSKIEYVGNDQVLIITEAGQLYTLGFEKVGGTYSIGDITKIDEANYKGILLNGPIMLTKIEDMDSCFVCCQCGDSLLINWKNTESAAPLKATLKKEDASKIADVQEDDDSWLYKDEGDDDKNNDDSNLAITSSLSKCKFEIVDSLINCGPLSDFTIGKVSKEPKLFGLPNPNLNEDAIVASSGAGANSAISVFNPTVKPVIKSTLKFSNVDKIWTLADINGQSQYLITTDYKNYKTQVFQIGKNYKILYAHDLNNKQITVQFGTINSKLEMNIVQVTPFKVLLYDFNFKQLMSVDYEHEINSASIYDKYVIVITQNGEIDILEFIEKTNELEKIDLPALLNYLIFTNGWIADSSILNHVADYNLGVKRNREGDAVQEEENTTTESTFWLVTADNRLLVFKKEHKEKVFEFKDIQKFPEQMQVSRMDPNYEADVDPVIKQAMFTKLGDRYSTKDYLIVLSFGGEVMIYETYFDPSAKTYKLLKINDMCQFPIIGAPDNSYAHATRIERNLIKVDNIQGYNSVLVTGASAYVIIKEHTSMPRLFQFTPMTTLYFAGYNHDSKCQNGFISIDDKKACRICQFDLKLNYSNRIPIRKISVGDCTINKISYHKRSHLYVISCLKEIPYIAQDEDGTIMQGTIEDAKVKAHNYKGYIHLVSPVNWTIIDTVELEDCEVSTSIKIMEMKISESSTYKSVVIIGTAQYKVEDISTNGSWKLYEIIDVVPEPGKPEAKNRLKLITSETSRGPVLSIAEVSGRFATVQGQRLLVRTLQSDNNVAPVAFTDTNVYSKEVKSFENLMAIADSYQSVSLHGFDATPYRLLTLGKDELNVNVTAFDFVIHNANLYILIADEDSVLHLLQYDPYDPESLKGSKLLRRSVLRFNGYTTHMTSVPRTQGIFSMLNTLPVESDTDMGYEVIASNIDGSFYKVIPVNEYQYRRLYTIQNYLNDKEVHSLGLNPKMNAIGGLDYLMPSIKRPFIDMTMFKKFANLNGDKKQLVLSKLGKNSYLEMYQDLISLQ